MDNSAVEPISFRVLDVGRNIKSFPCPYFSTKKKYIWFFRLNGREHRVELYNSVLSGKKKIVHNGVNVFFAKYDCSSLQEIFRLSTLIHSRQKCLHNNASWRSL